MIRRSGAETKVGGSPLTIMGFKFKLPLGLKLLLQKLSGILVYEERECLAELGADNNGLKHREAIVI